MAIVNKPGENSYYKPKASIIAEIGSRTNLVNHSSCANSPGLNLQPTSPQQSEYAACNENKVSNRLSTASAREEGISPPTVTPSCPKPRRATTPGPPFRVWVKEVARRAVLAISRPPGTPAGQRCSQGRPLLWIDGRFHSGPQVGCPRPNRWIPWPPLLRPLKKVDCRGETVHSIAYNRDKTS